MLAGSVKVRAVTCNRSTKTMPIQMNPPLAAAGAGEEEGRTARYGAKKYAMGKRTRKYRNERSVPRRAWTGG